MDNSFSRWLYSKDHGSIVVDTPEDAVNLPAVDWWTTSTFDGEPYIRAMTPDQALDAMAADAEELGLQADVVVVTPENIATVAVENEWVTKPGEVVLDKRTKAYKDSQKAPL